MKGKTTRTTRAVGSLSSYLIITVMGLQTNSKRLRAART